MEAENPKNQLRNGWKVVKDLGLGSPASKIKMAKSLVYELIWERKFVTDMRQKGSVTYDDVGKAPAKTGTFVKPSWKGDVTNFVSFHMIFTATIIGK